MWPPGLTTVSKLIVAPSFEMTIRAVTWNRSVRISSPASTWAMSMLLSRGSYFSMHDRRFRMTRLIASGEACVISDGDGIPRSGWAGASPSRVLRMCWRFRSTDRVISWVFSLRVRWPFVAGLARRSRIDRSLDMPSPPGRPVPAGRPEREARVRGLDFRALLLDVVPLDVVLLVLGLVLELQRLGREADALEHLGAAEREGVAGDADLVLHPDVEEVAALVVFADDRDFLEQLLLEAGDEKDGARAVDVLRDADAREADRAG